MDLSALYHCKYLEFQLYDKIRRSEQKYKVALEVLSYHSKAPDDELNQYQQLPIPEQIPKLTK